MNGFDLINRYKIEEYITAMSNAIPYNYNKSKCIDIKVKDVNISLTFMNAMDIPNKYDLEILVTDLLLLDEQIAKLPKNKQLFEKTGNKYELSYIEIESPEEIALFYCGIDVNAQWGVEFVHENEKWEFSGLVKYTIFWT
jgi:hypothetical protein